MYQSKKAYDPQTFEAFWKPFVRFFQTLCVANHSIFHSKDHVGRLIYFIIFSLLHLALMCYTLLHGLHIQMRPSGKYKQSQLMFYINFVSVAGNLITHIAAHFEPLFNRKHEQEIYRKLNEINEIFAKKLNYVADFGEMRKTFIWHTCAFFMYSATISFGYSFYSLPDDSFGAFLFLFNRILAVVIIRARRCQMAFLVNMMTHILNDLQILLKQQQQNYRPHSADSPAIDCNENIRYLRDVYSNVWIVKNLLSSGYGWSFLSFLMEFSFDLINSSYWAYINIQIYESRNMIIRKMSEIAMKLMETINFDMNICYFRDCMLHLIHFHEFLVHLHDMRTMWKNGLIISNDKKK